ncbi:MAG TPA: hypothetical protein VEK73_04465, partial [Xanthobacteraceae bacterium]|nr:hypothetical protein [Xanthobacteraceae bacterium]
MSLRSPVALPVRPDRNVNPRPWMREAKFPPERCVMRSMPRRPLIAMPVRCKCPNAPKWAPPKCPPPHPRASDKDGVSAPQANAATMTASRNLGVTGIISLCACLSRRT